MGRTFYTSLWMCFVLMVAGCASRGKPQTVVAPITQYNDVIIAAGQAFRIGTPVILWDDPRGLNAYEVSKVHPAGKLPFGERPGDPQTIAELVRQVDQFVIHYDAVGDSHGCFRVLHDQRGLSAHFLLDTDGTIYQTLDLKERAWHAGVANDRSVGIEIANVGAYPPTQKNKLVGSGLLVEGVINGRALLQRDFTEAQYQSLVKLTAGLSRVLPGIRLGVPRDATGEMITRTLTPAQLETFRGLLGHFHVSEQKVDPGPAFQWDRLLREARELRDQ